MLAQTTGPARFIHLHQALAEIAACPMVDAFARCVVSYQARSYGDLPVGMYDPAMNTMEHAMVDALRRGDLDGAELLLGQMHARGQALAVESFDLLSAAE